MIFIFTWPFKLTNISNLVVAYFYRIYFVNVCLLAIVLLTIIRFCKHTSKLAKSKTHASNKLKGYFQTTLYPKNSECMYWCDRMPMDENISK